LSNGPASLNAKIREEIAENEGSTIWSEQRVKLSDCIEQKNRAKIGNVWEKRYAEFVSYDGMPKRGTRLYFWQQNQLSNGPASLNAKIREEIAENEGSTIWSEQRVKLSDCVEQKNRVKIGAWEKRYAEFVSYDGMPKRGTPQLNWQQHQLSNGPASLNAKIREEIAENKGSTIWSERRVKLSDCVEQKRRE